MQNGGNVGKRKLIADLLLIGALLVVALSVFLVIELTRADGVCVQVSVDGHVVAEYPLSEDGEYSLNGGTNLLVISGGEAYMKYADCPDGLCIGQGRVSRAGQTVVCLPNRVMIKVVGGDAEVELEVR